MSMPMYPEDGPDNAWEWTPDVHPINDQFYGFKLADTVPTSRLSRDQAILILTSHQVGRPDRYAQVARWLCRRWKDLS